MTTACSTYYNHHGQPDLNATSGALTPNSLTPQTIKLHTSKDFFDLQGAGWYDNQARYYDCLIPTFKSQDPLAEKYPWLSPYNHCANNPMRFVDPTGMDTWEITDRGEIVCHITNEEDDLITMVNQDRSPMIDNEGDVISISFKKGTILSQKSRKARINNNVVDIDIFKVRGDENGLNLFKFLSDNVSIPEVGIEYSLFQTGMPGKNGLNFVSTSHMVAADASGGLLFENQLKYGYYIRNHYHSHPEGNEAGNKDNSFANNISEHTFNKYKTQPLFYIYHVPTYQFINYKH